MMNHDIFISYSSKQKSIADGVCHYLEENGFKCWMAPRDIPVGSEYGDLIEEAIKTSKVVVLVFSQTASISKWVKGEINVAFADNKPILPFRVDKTEIKGSFRLMLNQMHWIDAFPQYADRLPELLNSVCGFLGRQPQKVSNESERLEAERKTKEAAERARLEKEKLERAEAERNAKEIAKRERLECERADTQRKTELEKANQLKVLDNPQPKPKRNLWIGIGVVAVVVLVLFLAWPKRQSLSVSGSYNGHDYVDLGLPSGIKWATYNVGATRPEGYGDYFAWGETGKKTTYSWLAYQYCNFYDDKLTKYCDKSIYGNNGFTDNLTTLQPSDDAATVNWGIGWRMPTPAQWWELKENTYSQWTRRNGVRGILFTAKNGQTLFLPSTGHRFDDKRVQRNYSGYYWSSSLSTDDPRRARGFYFTENAKYTSNFDRHYGQSIRAVYSAE